MRNLRNDLEARLRIWWYETKTPPIFLRLLSKIYGFVIQIRRQLYQKGLCARHRLPVPVIVVGNVTVGGTGKTPLVAAIVRHLQKKGHRPGVVTRGYLGKHAKAIEIVHADSNASRVGDEALWLFKALNCPVAVGAARVATIKHLLAQSHCTVIVCDDGLQHLSLLPSVAIAVVDASVGFGNGWLLPAGPLREPLAACQVDAWVIHKRNGLDDVGKLPVQGFSMRSDIQSAYSLIHPEHTLPLAAFLGERVHAVAGIARPEGFFDNLRKCGLRIESHAFPDHHAFSSSDLQFAANEAILMTEKDAIKCREFAGKNVWVVPQHIEISDDFWHWFEQRTAECGLRIVE